jgi:2-keto-myo-inositol isomerase
MILGFNGATTMNADLQTDVTVAAGAGFQALEIWAAKMDRYLENHTVSELKALFDEHRILPASINSIEFITFRKPEEYEEIRQRCTRLSEVCRVLGCDRIVVVPGPLPEGGASPKEVREESVKVLRDLSGIAGSFGVNLAFEFLGFPWCSVRTLEASQEIVQETDRENLGLVVDTCHFYAGGSGPDSIESMDPASLFIFHINDVEDRPRETVEDAHRLLPGEGVIPLNDILSRLARTGFNGLCSVELFRPAYWDRDPAELARDALRKVREVLEPWFPLSHNE